MATSASSTSVTRGWLAVAAALAALLLGGCAGSTNTGNPGPGTVDPVPDAARDFQRKCEQGLSDWREGRIAYPERLTVRLGGTVTYEAAVDIRDNPLPADQVIDTEGGTAGTAQIFVRCRLAARLTALGDQFEVALDDEAEGSGWVYQEFTPSGVIEWAWSVTATEPTDGKLRLDLRPSLQVNELPSYSSANQVSFTTDVSVEASVLERAWFWIQSQWPLVLGVATPIGAGILALLAWIKKVRAEVAPGGPRYQPPSAPPSGGPPPTPPSPPHDAPSSR